MHLRKAWSPELHDALVGQNHHLVLHACHGLSSGSVLKGMCHDVVVEYLICTLLCSIHVSIAIIMALCTARLMMLLEQQMNSIACH